MLTPPLNSYSKKGTLNQMSVSAVSHNIGLFTALVLKIAMTTKQIKPINKGQTSPMKVLSSSNLCLGSGFVKASADISSV